MKIKEGFVLREVAGSDIVVPTGKAQLSFNGIMTLNDVGKFIWKMLERETGASREEIIDAVLAEYDADAEAVEKDVDRFIFKLRTQSLIED